jgi:hypothetical protein
LLWRRTGVERDDRCEHLLRHGRRSYGGRCVLRRGGEGAGDRFRCWLLRMIDPPRRPRLCCPTPTMGSLALLHSEGLGLMGCLAGLMVLRSMSLQDGRYPVETSSLFTGG